MFGKRIKRGVPEINATSTADMAFMLLVFFLLATSMGVKKSIRRELPPSTDSVRVEPLRVKERRPAGAPSGRRRQAVWQVPKKSH